MGLSSKYVLAEEPIPAPEYQCGHEWTVPPFIEGGEPQKQVCLRAKDHAEGHSSMTNEACPGIVAYVSRKLIVEPQEGQAN